MKLNVHQYQNEVKQVSDFPCKSKFKASEGWVRKFVKRNNLVLQCKAQLAKVYPRILKVSSKPFMQRSLLTVIFPSNLFVTWTKRQFILTSCQGRSFPRKGEDRVSALEQQVLGEKTCHSNFMLYCFRYNAPPIHCV